jgi:hypothetical protein
LNEDLDQHRKVEIFHANRSFREEQKGSLSTGRIHVLLKQIKERMGIEAIKPNDGEYRVSLVLTSIDFGVSNYTAAPLNNVMVVGNEGVRWGQLDMESFNFWSAGASVVLCLVPLQKHVAKQQVLVPVE